MTVYFVDGAVGDDGNAGTSEGAGNAWATIDRSMSGVAIGDKVWIKDSATYFETATIVTAGGDQTPIVYEGYASTTGDNGVATIDGSGLTNCVASSTLGNLWNVFKNFRFTGADSSCVDLGGDDITVWKNCRFDNAGVDGISAGSNCYFEDCQFDNNNNEGADVTTSYWLSCVTFGQGIGMSSSRTIIANSLFYGHTSIHIAGPSSSAEAVVVGCTLDGENVTADGIRDSHTGSWPSIIANNIIYDNVTGVRNNAGDDRGEMQIHRNNLYNSNTTDHPPNFDTTGKVTSAPRFVDEASNDYRLREDSPAVAAGLDAGAMVG